MKYPLRILCLLLLPATARAAEPVDYQRQIQPILARHCRECHGPDKQRSGLRLDSVAGLLQGGNSGPAITPGRGAESRLIQAVTGAGGLKVMPPKEPRLSEEQIALLRKWIDQGAKAPPGELARQTTAPKSTHWAFRPPVRPPVPPVRNPTWVRNPIDHFILARLERAGIAPAPEADRTTLIRRLSLDLLGLPPSVREVEEFLADRRPDAYERLVDRLLASPHYGERWGRHWLDLARYADSHGFNIDAPRSIWPYRDWVLAALNRDLPFDQFTIQQLAGDLLPGATAEQKIATGFHRNTLINMEGGIDVEQFRVESVVDRVNTTGAVFLGLTVGCAQCHDHKYDPISQRDFYQLFAFFNSSDEPTLEVGTPEQLERSRQVRARRADVEKRLKVLDAGAEARQVAWEKRLTPELKATFPAPLRTILALPDNGRTPKQAETLARAYRDLEGVRFALGGLGNPLPFLGAAHLHAARTRVALERQLAQLKKRDPEAVTTMVLQERKTPRPTYIHLGGDFLRHGAPVSPATPAVLPPLPKSEHPGPANRLDLARWLVDPANPLTARVTVNRVWLRYFGTGLVETENDFGKQGSLPTHPELLDWLAREFVERGWSLKALHRLIVTSATYRQSSHHRPELATIDPGNRLLARQARLRLDAEVVRDVALAASGLLAPKVGGPSVFPPQPDGVYRFTQIPRDWKPSPGPDRYRRGLYTHFWRSAPYPALTVFDAPDSTTTCTRRNRSNTPLQALTLLNDEAFFELAQGLAGRILREAPSDDAERIEHAFRLCLSRKPSDRERQRLRQLLAEARALPDSLPVPQEAEAQERAAWTTVARVLLNLDEFITRE